MVPLNILGNPVAVSGGKEKSKRRGKIGMGRKREAPEDGVPCHFQTALWMLIGTEQSFVLFCPIGGQQVHGPFRVS